MIHFRTATLDVTPDKIEATFSDGRRNVFHLSAMEEDAEYRRIAAWAGYGEDWRLYGLEHELTHHWLADQLGWRWSWSLHENLPQPWPDHIAWEEHIVNRLQRHAHAGEPDEHGVLQSAFGDRLPDFIAKLRKAWEQAR